MSKVATTSVSDETTQESETKPRNTPSQASDGKFEPVNLRSVTYSTTTEVKVICLVALS